MNSMTETRRQRIKRIRAEIRSGDYDSDGAKLDRAIDLLIVAVETLEAARLPEPLHVEAERILFDAVNEGDRFDGGPL